MAKAGKALLGLAAGLGALGAVCLTVPGAICRRLGAERRTVDFAGQKTGAFLINGKGGRRAAFYSTEYTPCTVERTGGKLVFAAGGLLAMAILAHGLGRKRRAAKSDKEKAV